MSEISTKSSSKISTKELIDRLRTRLVRMSYIGSTDYLIDQAADRLEQLEAENARLNANRENVNEQAEKWEHRALTAEAERDAAVEDLISITVKGDSDDACEVCKHASCSGDEAPCADCLGQNFEWRGVQPEGSEK